MRRAKSFVSYQQVQQLTSLRYSILRQLVETGVTVLTAIIIVLNIPFISCRQFIEQLEHSSNLHSANMFARGVLGGKNTVAAANHVCKSM